jgi:hypothetical protein
MKSGTTINAAQPKQAAAPTTPIIAPYEITSLKCSSLDAPIWFGRYDYKRNKIVLVLDGNSGYLTNSIGL